MPVLDRGFLFADSVYEVMRTRSGTPFAWREHLDRLHRSAVGIGLELGLDDRDLMLRVVATLDASRADRSPGERYVRVIATRGTGTAPRLDLGCAPGPPRIIVLARRLTDDVSARPVRVATVTARSTAIDETIKSGDYLRNVLALAEARGRGADECILVAPLHGDDRPFADRVALGRQADRHAVDGIAPSAVERAHRDERMVCEGSGTCRKEGVGSGDVHGSPPEERVHYAPPDPAPPRTPWGTLAAPLESDHDESEGVLHRSVEEARTAVRLGASAVGLVSEMPSGPGVIAEEDIAAIAATVPEDVATFLLTSRTDPEEIAAQHRRCGTTTIQICDGLERGAHAALRAVAPDATLVQVIHVNGERSVEEARGVAPHVDALLLDSGNPSARVKTLGGTGRTHDWDLSARIVEDCPAPVFLAGGLNAANVTAAIRQVRPHGVDLCSGVRTDGALDERKLAEFFAAVASA